MESQITIPLPCSVGDKLYKLVDYKIVEYTVDKIKVESKVTDSFGVTSTIKIVIWSPGSSCTGTIEAGDLGTRYFFDKKDITKLIVDQL